MRTYVQKIRAQEANTRGDIHFHPLLSLCHLRPKHPNGIDRSLPLLCFRRGATFYRWRGPGRPVRLNQSRRGNDRLHCAVFGTPVLAPVMGYFIGVSYLGWRWDNWLSAIMGPACTCLVLCFPPETSSGSLGGSCGS